MKTYTKEEIAKILDLHAKWLNDDNDDNGGIKANLSGCNLRGCDFSYSDLRGCDLSNSNLRGCNLRGCDLSGCDLCGCDLSGCDLSGCDLSGAKTDQRYIQISCIGSSKRMTTYCFEDNYIWCGCFKGTLEEFETQVYKTHVNNKQYLAEYLGFINYLRSLQNVK